MKKKIFFLFFTLLIFNLSLMSVNASLNSKNIVIGNKGFTEQRILSNVLATYIENNSDYNVEIKDGIGETKFLNEALEDDSIDLYVEYSATAFLDIFDQIYSNQTNQEILDFLDENYKNTNSELLVDLGFENSNAIICGKFCTDNNITSLDQLSSFDNIKIGAPANFFKRPDGLNLIENTYNIKFKPENKITLDHSLIYSALSHNDVDIVLGYTTDSDLNNQNFTILDDEKKVFPPYEAIIVANKNLPEEIKDLLLNLDHQFTLQEIQQSNFEVEQDNKKVETVAQELTDNLE